MRFLPTLCVLSLAPLFPAATPTPQVDQFQTPTKGLTIPAREPGGWNLDQLLREYGEVTNQHFMIQEEARSALSHTRVSLDSELTIAPESVHSVVESILVDAGYVFGIAREASPRLITVTSTSGSRRGALEGSARFLSVDELEGWRDHPAYIVQTAVTLDALDVRQLTNSLRAMLSDANVQQIIPVGRSSTVIIKGLGPQVEGIAQLLLKMNEVERAAQKAEQLKESSEPQAETETKDQ